MQAQKPNAPPPIGSPPPLAAQPGVPGSGSAPAAVPPTSSGNAASATSAAAGKALFTGSAGCGACHTLAAAGTAGTVGPNLTVRLASDCKTPASMRIRGATLAQCVHTAIVNPYGYLPSGFAAGVMPSTFSHTLTAAQIQSLVNFLVSVTK